jgi:hypothetical protein
LKFVFKYLKYLYTICLIYIISIGNSQDIGKFDIERKTTFQNITGSLKPLGEFSLQDTADILIYHMQPLPLNKENCAGDSNELKQLISQKKQYYQNQHNTKDIYTLTVAPPEVTKTFLAQPASSQFTPNDNSLAVSNSGYILSCINSSFYVFDTLGVNLKKGSFNTIIKIASLVGGFFYDPRAIYDPITDRFYMVVLYGQSPSNSSLILCVSQSNNPSNLWNVYEFIGGFGSSDLWVDYPQVGISNNEIFITGNLFDASNVFKKSVILQINKSEAIQGQSISFKTWIDIGGNPFSLSPATPASVDQFNQKMFFVCNDAVGGNKLYIYTINENQKNNPSINRTEIIFNKYNKAPDAYQKGSNDKLDQGGCRIKNAYLKDGLIHTVFSKSSSTGFGSVVYARIDMDNYLFETKEYNESGVDLAFPSVAPASNKKNNKLAYIYVLASSNERYPESRVLLFDQNMNSSSTQVIKQGEGYVDALTGNERWGDYTTILKTYETTKVSLWSSGSFGTLNHKLGNIVSYFNIEKDSAYLFSEQFNIEIWPNPVENYLNIKYEIPYSVSLQVDLVSMNGVLYSELDLIKELRSINLVKTYRIQDFSPGIYLLNIHSGKEVLAKKKLVILPTK